MPSIDSPVLVVFQIIALLFVLTIHEFCHALVAYRLGDPTAKIMGRLTLNPLAHLDFFGTLALFFLHFGWAKPVQVNPENLRYPKRDSALVALAGPVSNLVTAILLAIPMKYVPDLKTNIPLLYLFLNTLYAWSVLVFSLNILPLPPFDGSKVVGIFIPNRWQPAYERFLRQGVAYILIFVLFDIFILSHFYKISILGTIVTGVSDWIDTIIFLGI